MDYATGVLFKAHYTELLRQAAAERMANAAARASSDEPVPRSRRRTRRFLAHAHTT